MLVGYSIQLNLIMIQQQFQTIDPKTMNVSVGHLNIIKKELIGTMDTKKKDFIHNFVSELL